MPETNFFWDPLTDNILQERDETGAVTAEYMTEPGLYGNLISQNQGGVESQYHFDALGSTMALTDDNQQVTDTNAYSAFGEVTEHTGATENAFKYNGQAGYYSGNATGDYSARRRHLLARLGRWLSTDPLLGLDGPNLFEYAHNKPTDELDPDGMLIFRRWRCRRRRCRALPQPTPALPQSSTASLTRRCPSDDPKCKPESCYWDNRIEDSDKDVALSFVKQIVNAAGDRVETPCCIVDRNFSALQGGESQLKLILVFVDGTTTGNIGSHYGDLRSIYGGTFEGNLVTPRPGDRPVIRIPKSYGGRTLKSVELQERLRLTCDCGGESVAVFWCFNLKWELGSTSGWSKVVGQQTDCDSVKP